MGISVKIDRRGLDTLIAASKRIDSATAWGLAFDQLDAMRMTAPVDTGYLARTAEVKTDNERTARVVFTGGAKDRVYALYVERGTRKMAPRRYMMRVYESTDFPAWVVSRAKEVLGL